MNGTTASVFLVVMGVAGCGKSSVGVAIAQAVGVPLIEGDDHHSASSLDKMSRGVALADDDRAGWLATLGGLLRSQQGGVVLTCSALKRAYRDQLRAACGGLRFAFLDIDRPHAFERVAARAGKHFFSIALVESQFQTLESPVGEEGVLKLDALLPVSQLEAQATAWLVQTEPTP